MLDERMREEIRELIGRYPAAKAAGPEALRIVQDRRGWVSDEDLADVAGMLGMSFAELDSVATYYNLIFRKPVGRHVILLCDSICCHIARYEAVRDRLSAKLGIGWGGTTADGRFTLLPIACLGACDHAPAMMVDEDLHGDLTPDGVDGILERYK
jgi:NADH-quinone oxidoreductase subunit E